MKKFSTTEDVEIPKDPFQRIIGQDEAVKIAKIAVKQRRHLLLVGPPGTGKSMIAKAISILLPPPNEAVILLHNENNPNRPIVKITKRGERERYKKEFPKVGEPLSPSKVPSFVAEKLGYRCGRCGAYSSNKLVYCPSCGAFKIYLGKRQRDPFEDIIPKSLDDLDTDTVNLERPPRIYTTRIGPDGKEEIVAYESRGDKILLLRKRDIEKLKEWETNNKRRVLIPFNRKLLVQATGASETELLGDIQHDPYGGHPRLGTPAFLRVVPGAVHEAHEGVLYIDELSTLGEIQRYLFTAMQDKEFPISGRNPMSAGASVRVDHVPCDFMLVGAVNINDLPRLFPALRSRIRGDGYEVLMKTVMEDTPENVKKIIQFVAQEINMDGKIPHATYKAVMMLVDEARRMARRYDGKEGLTLRLRNLSGIIRLAGDSAVQRESDRIEPTDVRFALGYGKSIEEKINEEYGGNWYRQGMIDYADDTKIGPTKDSI